MALGPLDLPGNLVCQHYPKNRNTSFILYNCTHRCRISAEKNLNNYIVSWILHLHKDDYYPSGLLATNISKDLDLHSLKTSSPGYGNKRSEWEPISKIFVEETLKT